MLRSLIAFSPIRKPWNRASHVFHLQWRYRSNAVEEPIHHQSDVEELINVESKPAQSKRFLEKGKRAIAELERLLQFTDASDSRLQPKMEDARSSLRMAIAAETSNADALLALARLHLFHEGPGLSADVGLVLLRHVANAGLADAQFVLSRYLWHDEKEADDEANFVAFSYLRKAAKQKHTEALFFLGLSLSSEEETQYNFAEAKSCFLAAAEQGHSNAATMYGAILAREVASYTDYREDTSSQDREEERMNQRMEARAWLEAAALNGDTLALKWLQAEKIPVLEVASTTEESLETGRTNSKVKGVEK